MPTSRTAVNIWTAAAGLTLAAFPLAVACSSGSNAGGPSTNAPGGSSNVAGGTSAAGGSNATGGGAISDGGSSTQGGASTTGGGATSGGSGGVLASGGTNAVAGSGTGGSATAGSGTGGGSDNFDCGTPPWRKLNVTATAAQHVHGKFGVDPRAKTMLGKLIVDLGVTEGGYSQFLAKRGYHSMGISLGGECPAPDLAGDRTRVGTCRMGEFATITTNVKNALTSLQASNPEEDWGYFLTQDGKDVRWSDIAISGDSHGATTAAISGRLGACMWRVLSRSGPRDNTCGLGNGQCTIPLSTPSYDPACPDAKVAAWLDQPSKTPMDRFYSIAGTQDGQCGDIQFNMHRTGYLGVPTIFDTAGAVFTGTHQFFSTTQGHYDFLAAPTGAPNTPAVLEIVFAIPPENRSPTF